MSGLLPIPTPIRRNFTCESYLEPCGGLIDVVKNEISNQPGGYTAGDTITYEVSVINTGKTSIAGSVLYETLEPIDIRYDPLGLIKGGACLPPGWTTKVVYDYTVTEKDILEDYVTGVVCLSAASILPTVLLKEDEEVLYGETTLSAVFVLDSDESTFCNDNEGDYTAFTTTDDNLLFITEPTPMRRGINLTNSSANAICTSLRTKLLRPAQANITKTLVSDQSPYAPGDVIRYQITVNSTGDSPIRNVKLVDTLQPNIDIIAGQDLFSGGVEILARSSKTAI